MKLSHVLHYTVIQQLYEHDTNIPVNTQNWVNMSTSVRAHKLKQYIFLGVHVQPEQRMNTFEVP